MPIKLEIKHGQVFGNFTVVKEIDKIITPSGQSNRMFLCKCICGNDKKIRLLHLKRNRIISCGCIYTPFAGDPIKTYIRKIWRAIKYRTSKTYFESHLYFDKGVKMSDEWLNNFDEFYKWGIENNLKKGFHIDRINGNGNYCKENCRVVTPLVNANNRENTFMVNYNGKEIPFMDIIREKQLMEYHSTIRRRIKRGWNHQEAIDFNIKIGNYRSKRNKRNFQA